jgi:hypothetical protein
MGGALVSGRRSRVTPGTRGGERSRRALGAWQAAVVRCAALDPVTTELVRLRCANHHDCHT